MRRHTMFGSVAVLLAIGGAGCSASSGSSTGSSPAPTSSATASTPPPAPDSSNPACVISADCPAGEHCDLEECVQDCSTAKPCTGGLTCSPRGRCLSPGTPDADPTPTGKYQGTLTVTPANVLLTGKSTSFNVTLKSDSTQPVRYRLQLDGSYMSVAKTSGSFTGSTTITVNVDSSSLKGQDATGDLKVYTTLGDGFVAAPIHAGVTGSYKGKLSYDQGPITLGDTSISLDVLESSGAVQGRINSQDSLLFPATASGDTTGVGTYSDSNGLDVTVGQVVDTQFGGAANPFGRPVGRTVRLRLKPDSLTGLEGTFDETIVGLFAEPVTTSGHVTLRYTPQANPPSFTLTGTPPMPSSPSATATAAMSVLGMTDSCYCYGYGYSQSQILTGMGEFEQSFATPLLSAFQNQTSNNQQPFFENIATACADSLSLTGFSAYQSDSLAQACGLPQGVACAQQCGAAHISPSDPQGGPMVGRLTAELLQAPLLVAKQEIVDALEQSFTGGLTQEMAHYTNAMSALAPYSAWVVQPAVLEFLRDMPPASAQGPSTTSNQTQQQPYPSVRALSDLFYTQAMVRGEQTRIEAASTGTGNTDRETAQAQALLNYLEIAVVRELLTQWGTTPPTVASDFTGALTPLDEGFSALLEGGNVFGVPDGFVPFVYRPEDVGKGASNFEQMLAIAANAVSNENSVETQFLADERAYDTAVSQLQQELANVKLQYDERISDDCGTAFNPDAVTSTDDPSWSNCGAGNSGAVGQANLSIQEAAAQLASAQQRITGQKQKIKIDVDALAQSESVQEASIAFISNTGQQIAAVDFASGTIDACMAAMQVAAQADVLNGGAPLGESACQLMLGEQKAALTAQRDQLQTAETMETQEASNKQADIAAMANIQKEEIDLAQAGVDINQQVVAMLQTSMQAADKLAEAKQIWSDRQRQLTVDQQDPTHDPSYRLLRDSLAVQVLSARASAQQQLYLATSALEYEINQSISDAVGSSMRATNATNLGELQSCLLGIYNNARVAYGSPQDYVTTVSVRKMLGIDGPRKDSVTGQTLSEGDQFRQLLLANQNLDGQGGVGIKFSTDLQAGNGLWATDVCDDRIASVQAQIVGNFSGDNEAQVNLALSGGAVLRACGSDTLTTWSLGATSTNQTEAVAVIQAGVNTFGEANPNTSLFGQSVARANWTLIIPGGQVAPANADIDLTSIDDVVLRFDHKALPQQSSPVSIDLSCLGNVGQ